MNEQVREFLHICEAAPFPRREELLQGIKSGKCVLEDRSTSRVPSKQLLRLYELRVRHLRKRISAEEISDPHAERLLSDTENLVIELAKSPDEIIDLWRFSIDESTQYGVFEAVNAKRVLGCLLTVDKRRVSDGEWESLWGSKEEL